MIEEELFFSLNDFSVGVVVQKSKENTCTEGASAGKVFPVSWEESQQTFCVEFESFTLRGCSDLV